MLILRRLAVWFFEVTCEALLFSLFLALWWGDSEEYRYAGITKDWYLMFRLTIGVFMTMTGYILTTALLRAFWRGQKMWLFSAGSVALFLLHIQIVFLSIRHWSPSDRILIPTVGAGVVFACTFVGSWLLRKWDKQVAERSSLAEKQHQVIAKS